MCRLMKIPFKDLGEYELKQLRYEPGSKIYTYRHYKGNETQFSKTTKEGLGFLISFIDFLTIISLILFIKCLKKSQKYYLEKFKAQTIELDDFTIEMKNLPFDYEYGYDEDALKACLYSHFEDLIKREKEIKNQEDGAIIRSQKIVEEGKPDPLIHEIIDINFGKKENDAENLLEEMFQIKTKFEANNKKLSPE